MLSLASTATPQPLSVLAGRRLAHTSAPAGEYFAKKTSAFPPLIGPLPQLTVPATVPTATMLPPESIATPARLDESKLVEATMCWFHKNCPVLPLVVTVATAVSLLIAPCVSVTVSVAVYVPA